MAITSNIQWTDATWNPWSGCQKVSPGCTNCYMFRDKKRWKQDPHKIERSKTTFRAPLRWSEGRMIFTCSWSDFFIEEADQWRREAWAIIKATPQHTYQILTKRPERISECLPADWGEGYPNVWLGVSIESQRYASRAIALNDVPARIRFISFEPLIDEINWIPAFSSVDWIIIGGESGNTVGKYRYRPMLIPWAVSLVEKAREKGIACLVKQLGTYQAHILRIKDRHAGNIANFPRALRVREFPQTVLEKVK